MNDTSKEADKLLEVAHSFLPPVEVGNVTLHRGASGHYATHNSAPSRSVRLGDKIYFQSESALRAALIRAGYAIIRKPSE